MLYKVPKTLYFKFSRINFDHPSEKDMNLVDKIQEKYQPKQSLIPTLML